MASFHDQWMAALSELRQAQDKFYPDEYAHLMYDLGRARTMILEDNASAEQLGGGVIIREVRRYVRAA